MTRQKLSDAEAAQKSSELKNWRIADGKISKSFKFKNFAEALAFVNKAGKFADEMDHHPDIKFGWGYADFEITTHDAGGLTANDFKLAQAIENI